MVLSYPQGRQAGAQGCSKGALPFPLELPAMDPEQAEVLWSITTAPGPRHGTGRVCPLHPIDISSSLGPAHKKSAAFLPGSGTKLNTTR